MWRNLTSRIRPLTCDWWKDKNDDNCSPQGSSIVINIIKSVHRVLFFVTKKEYFENVNFGHPHMKMQCIIINILKSVLDPLPQRTLYSRENDDNSGWPLSAVTGYHLCLLFNTQPVIMLFSNVRTLLYKCCGRLSVHCYYPECHGAARPGTRGVEGRPTSGAAETLGTRIHWSPRRGGRPIRQQQQAQQCGDDRRDGSMQCV